MNDRSRTTEFTVRWPVQGLARFRSPESELVLSDVYWRWILDALSSASEGGQRPAFVEGVEDGFGDPVDLVETIPVDERLLGLLRRVEPSRAPSFERLVPTEDSEVPSPEQILATFERLLAESLASGAMEMEIE
jgi:hypothetical protein